MDLGSIFKTIKKNKLSSSAFIIELSLGSIIIMLALASYQYCLGTLNKSKEVLVPNVYRVDIIQKSDDLMGTDLAMAGQDSMDAIMQKTQFLNSLLEKNKNIETIGKGENGGFGFLPEDREQANMIKCPINNVDVYSQNKELTKMYDYKVKEGMSFAQYYSSNPSSEKVIPILITEELQKDNPIGSIIRFPKNQNNYKIIGVLDRNYPTLENLSDQYGDTRYNLQYACVTVGLIDSEYFDIYVKLKDGADVEAVKKELDAEVSPTETVQFTSLNKWAENILNGKSYTIRFVYYGVVILILSSFGIICTVMNSVNRRKREFGVRISVGATKKYIEKLIVGEISVLFVISQMITLIFAFLMGRVSKGLAFNWKVITVSLGLVLFLTIISTVPVLVRVVRMKPIDLIHERR